MSKYFYSADIVRATAIVFVIVVHVCGEYLGKGLALGTVGWWFANILETLAKVAVPLFVMLSGSLLLDPQKEYSLKEFYRRRFSTIGFPLLFWPLFYYLSLHLLKRITITLTGFVNDYIFLNMFYHLYFLYIIAGLYLVAPFLQKMLSYLNPFEKKVFVSGALLFSVLITPLVYFTQSKISYWSIFTVFIPFIGYFLAGQHIQDLKLTKKQIRRRLLIYTLITLAIAICKYFSYAANSYNFSHYFDDALSVGVMAMSLFVYPVLQNLDKAYSVLSGSRIKNAVVKLSAASFGIYLIHPILLFCEKIFFERMIRHHSNPFVGIVILLVTTVSVLISTLWVVQLLKRVPIVRSLI